MFCIGFCIGRQRTAEIPSAPPGSGFQYEQPRTKVSRPPTWATVNVRAVLFRPFVHPAVSRQGQRERPITGVLATGHSPRGKPLKSRETAHSCSGNNKNNNLCRTNMKAIITLGCHTFNRYCGGFQMATCGAFACRTRCPEGQDRSARPWHFGEGRGRGGHAPTRAKALTPTELVDLTGTRRFPVKSSACKPSRAGTLRGRLA